jgi:regulator of nonsense transcripts 2
MDIEFIIQDVFALTRPQWKLASNIEEASRAFQLAMAQDQKTSGMDKVAEPVEADSDSSSDDGIDDGEAEGEAEAGVADAEAEAEEDSDSEDEADVSPVTPVSLGPSQLTWMKLEANPTAHDSEDESIVVTRDEEEVDPEDEAEFEREYAKMMAESLDSRKHERKSTFDVPLPMRRKDREINSANDAWNEESTAPDSAPTGTMAFSLLTKRGNRQQVSHIIRRRVYFTNNIFNRLALLPSPLTLLSQSP